MVNDFKKKKSAILDCILIKGENVEQVKSFKCFCIVSDETLA